MQSAYNLLSPYSDKEIDFYWNDGRVADCNALEKRQGQGCPS